MDDVNKIIFWIENGNAPELEQAINHDPSIVHLKTEHGISLLQHAAYYRNLEVINLIRKYVDATDIYEAATLGEVDRVIQLYDKEPESINTFSADGFTPLGLATYFGHYPIVLFLLEKGADPNLASRNEMRVTAIHSACAISNFEIAELLIRYGADVNVKQKNGFTPLHAAAHNGKNDLVKLLINHGANLNAHTNDGQTPLDLAKEKGFKETGELLKYGE